MRQSCTPRHKQSLVSDPQPALPPGPIDDWVPPYLVLLLEAVALGALHLGDVLEEVGHANGRVQLTRLVWHVHSLALPQGVSVRLHQAAGVAAHVLALICVEGGGGGRKTEKEG